MGDTAIRNRSRSSRGELTVRLHGWGGEENPAAWWMVTIEYVPSTKLKDRPRRVTVFSGPSYAAAFTQYKRIRGITE
jgi:hypothetical protein